MPTVSLTATWNGAHWTYSPTQRPNGIRFDVDESSTISITIQASGTLDTVALASGTSNLIQWPEGNPSWFDSSTLSRVSDSNFTFTDSDPSSSYDVQYRFKIGFLLNGGSTVQWTPDPIVINRDPDQSSVAAAVAAAD